MPRKGVGRKKVTEPPEKEAKAGRPLKTVADEMPDGWEDAILGLYAEGASDIEIKAWLVMNLKSGSFSGRLWDRWIVEEEAFCRTITRGRLLAEAWWMRTIRENTTFFQDKGARRADAQLIRLMMQNCYGWAEKKEQTVEVRDKSWIDGQLRSIGMDPDQFWEDRKRARESTPTQH